MRWPLKWHGVGSQFRVGLGGQVPPPPFFPLLITFPATLLPRQGTVQAQPTDQRTPWGHAVESLATASTCQAPRVPEGTAPSAPLGAHDGATPGRRRKVWRVELPDSGMALV